MFTLILLSALAPAAPEPATGGSPPEQGLAIIDAKGNLRLVHACSSCNYGPMSPESERMVMVKRGDAQVAVKMKVTSVVLTTIVLPANAVDAYTVDGKRLAPEKLAGLLEKERSVLIAVDGKKVDPFLLELYKEGTIVLVPPSDVMNHVNGNTAPFYVPQPVPVTPERIPMPERKIPKPERQGFQK